MKTFLSLVAGLLVLALGTSPLPGGDDDRGLVGSWGFDEQKGAGVRDASGFGNGGELFGAERVAGKVGRGLAFAAPGSVVKIPCRASLNLEDALTVEAWIFPQDVGETSRVIVSKNDEYALRIDNPGEGGRLSFFVHVGTPAVTWEPRVSTSEPPVLHRWSHVAAVWDGAASHLYLDGERVASRERVGRPNPNPYPVMIGNWEYPSCHGTHFGGIIDEVRIYHRALTADEVRARYQAAR